MNYKKILILIIAILFFLSYANAVYITDGFEDGGTLNAGWLTAPGYAAPTESSDQHHTGSYSLKLTKSPQAGTKAYLDSNYFGQKITITVWFMEYFPYSAFSGIQLLDNSGKMIAGAYDWGNSFRYYSGTTNYDNGTFAQNDWQKVVINYNAATMTVDYNAYDYTNTLIASAMGLGYYTSDGGNGHYPYSIQFITGGTQTTTYFDDVNFGGTQATGIPQYPTIGNTTITGFTTHNNYFKGTGTILGGTFLDLNGSGANTSTCQYADDNINWQTAAWNTDHCEKTSYTPIDTNNYRFNFKVYDNAGNLAIGTPTSNYTYDSNKPFTRVTFTDGNVPFSKDINFYCNDQNGSGCALTQYRINSGAWQNYTTTFQITGSGTYSIDYNSIDNLGNTESTKTNSIYIIPDTVAPTLTYTIPKTYGFGVDLNIPFTLTCSGDLPYQLWFDVTVDGVSKLHVLDNNGITRSGSFTAITGSPTIVFSCTNLSGLATTITTSQAFQVLQFILVNENTGVPLTPTDIDNNFLIAKVYSIDGNYSYDFKANHRGDVNAVLPSKQLVFNFGYNDAQLTQINRVINGSIELTTPMRICAPFFQQFYEQQFISYTARSITLYNYPSTCYELQGQLNYLSSSNYGLSTYTTNMPMYLSTWVNGVKTFFSYIDGGTAQAYNLDVIALTRQTITYTPNLDGLGVAPLIDPITNLNDLNTLMIQYISGDSNNTSVNIQILNGSTVLYNQTYSDSNTANAFNLNWYYGGIPGITSATFFKIIVTAENPSGQKVTMRTVNADGAPPVIDIVVGNKTFYGNFPIMLSIVALIISSLFFFFAMSIASTGHTFGMFGILMVLACIAIAAVAVQIWYIDLIIGFYILVLLIIIFSGKPRSNTFG